MRRRSVIKGASAFLLTAALARPISIRAQEIESEPLPALDPLPTGKIVFQQSSGGDIYLMNSDTSDLRVIGQGIEPALSPDGTQVIYSRWEEPAGLYVYDIEQDTTRRIYDVVGARWPSWSPPDGRYIAFYEPSTSARLVPRLVDWDGYTRLEFVNDESWRISLLEGNRPADQGIPLPTARAIVGFNVIQNPQTQREVRIPESDNVAENSFSPAWSPDGKEIVFKAEWGLYRVNLRGESPELSWVPNTDFRFVAPQWSPDGTRILFLYRMHDHYEIGWISADGASGLQLLTRPVPFQRAANNVAPAYSPDGTKIAFLSDREEKDVYNIYVMNTDGSDQQKLLDIPIRYENQFERSINWGV